MDKAIRRTKILSALALLLATFLWGINYVSQQTGSRFLGPFTFNMFRMLIGAAFLFPVVLVRNYRLNGKVSFWKYGDNIKETLKGGFICGVILVVGITCQQAGIKFTSVGKAGFLSSLSVMFVPLISIFLGKKVKLYQWVGIFLSIIGVALLSLNEVSRINIGDVLMLGTALFIAFHIMSAGYFNKRVDSFQFSFFRFLNAGFVCVVFVILFENVTWEAIKLAWLPILFSGVFGSAFAFTLMAISQRNLDNIATSLIMSLESVFSVLSGWVLLKQGLTVREAIGCVVVFAAVLGMQLYGDYKQKIASL